MEEEEGKHTGPEQTRRAHRSTRDDVDVMCCGGVGVWTGVVVVWW